MSSEASFTLIAQANIARLRYPLDHPCMLGMASRIDEMNGLAESSPGFGWRFKRTEKEENRLSHFRSYLQPFDENRFFFNMSVWTDTDSLNAYVYRSLHSDMLRNRTQWVEELSVASLAVWQVEAGHHPSLREAVQRFQNFSASPCKLTLPG